MASFTNASDDRTLRSRSLLSRRHLPSHANVPVATEAFLDYQLNAMTLSGLEIEALRSGQPLATENKRELAEWEEKKKRLGLG